MSPEEKFPRQGQSNEMEAKLTEAHTNSEGYLAKKDPPPGWGRCPSANRATCPLVLSVDSSLQVRKSEDRETITRFIKRVFKRFLNEQSSPGSDQKFSTFQERRCFLFGRFFFKGADSNEIVS